MIKLLKCEARLLLVKEHTLSYPTMHVNHALHAFLIMVT